MKQCVLQFPGADETPYLEHRHQGAGSTPGQQPGGQTTEPVSL